MKLTATKIKQVPDQMKRDNGLLYKYSKNIGNLFEIRCNYEIHINTKCSPYCNAEWPSDKSTDDNCAHSNLKCTAINSIVTFLFLHGDYRIVGYFRGT